MFENQLRLLSISLQLPESNHIFTHIQTIYKIYTRSHEKSKNDDKKSISQTLLSTHHDDDDDDDDVGKMKIENSKNSSNSKASEVDLERE